jgi:hypothetical protein
MAVQNGTAPAPGGGRGACLGGQVREARRFGGRAAPGVRRRPRRQRAHARRLAAGRARHHAPRSIHTRAIAAVVACICEHDGGWIAVVACICEHVQWRMGA